MVLPPRLALMLPALLLLGLGGDATEEFLAGHWRSPLAPQGPPPGGFTALESSLHPEACGSCHPAQAADWQTSLHARAMGPGVSGQVVELIEGSPAEALGCQRCHAPLAEQAPRLSGDPGLPPNPAFDPPLQAKGLVCAGCHVRAHQRFGPPRRDGSLPSAAPPEARPHRGATRTAAFLASEFCRGCHQFAPDGLALNGKLLQDTYDEWRRSRWARLGVQCQDCHMPDRRHLWRGIHDPEMVRSALTITLTPGPDRFRSGATAAATLRVENTGAGHAVPTYAVPLIVLRGELIDAGGRLVEGSEEEVVVGRVVEVDLSRELLDTRLGPGEGTVLRYERTVPEAARGGRARFSVAVYPDAFYTRFYEALLAQGAGRGEGLIREALAATRRSPFVAWRRELLVE